MVTALDPDLPILKGKGSQGNHVNAVPKQTGNLEHPGIKKKMILPPSAPAGPQGAASISSSRRAELQGGTAPPVGDQGAQGCPVLADGGDTATLASVVTKCPQTQGLPSVMSGETCTQHRVCSQVSKHT